MATIKISVTGEICTVAQKVTFTAGSYGVYVAEVTTDASWDDLALVLCIISAPPGYPRMPNSGRCIKRSIPIKDGTAELDETIQPCMVSDNAILIGLLGCDADGKITRYSTVSAAGKVCGSGCIDDTILGDESRWAELISYINATINSLIGVPTDEQVRSAVDAYADEHGITTGATAEEAAQIEQNTTDITDLKSDLSQLSEEKVDKTAIMLATHTDGLIYLFVDGKPVGIGLDLSSGGTVIPDNPDEPEVTPPSYFNVNWSNYAITCGQNTNNYNAWAPNNLQYDSVNDAFIFLQCHANKHLNHTLTTWTLSRIYPDEPWKTEDLGLPEANKLGALWVENGTWYVLPMNDTTAYKSNNMGVTWEQFTINLSAPLWGIYKCDGVYYSGDDTNTDTYYTSTDLVTWETHTFGFSDSYSALMEASFCWYKDYVWAFLRTNDATLGHPVILKSADGLSWELVSDSMLHTYRSMVNCYPYKDYIILADIDRDNGILYYSRFDGETVETLNEWNVGDKGDDFHCPCICSDGKNTIIIEFMLHSWVHTGSFSDAAQYYCENMMLIGKTNSSELHSLTIEDIPFTNAKDFVETYCDVYPPEAVDNFTYSTNRITTTEAGYMAAVVMKEPNLFPKSDFQSGEYFYRGNVVASLYNSENLSRFGTGAAGAGDKFCALIEIEGKRYIYKYNTDATLPSIQLRTVEKELEFTPYNDNYPQISGVLEETADLGFTKQIPVHSGDTTYTNIYPHTKVTFVKAGLTSEEVPCTGISLSSETLTFTEAGTQTLTVTVEPEGCTDTVTWKSSDTGVATVSGGIVTAVGNGGATITAICGGFSDTCAVSVSGIISGETSLVYSLPESTTFDGTNYIDTGIQLFDTLKDFTILLDYEEGDNTSSATIFHCIKETNPWPGLCLQRNSNNAGEYAIGGSTSGGSNFNVFTSVATRVAITCTGGSITGVKHVENGDIVTASIKANSGIIFEKNLLLGCYQTDSGDRGRYWNGTINKFDVYFEVLSDEEVGTWLTVE